MQYENYLTNWFLTNRPETEPIQAPLIKVNNGLKNESQTCI